MELWIRSQDRTTLIRSYEIYIVEQREMYMIRAKRTSHILGAYKNIERALEVLDEINRHIEELCNCKYGIEYDLSQFTYEMPKE